MKPRAERLNTHTHVIIWQEVAWCRQKLGSQWKCSRKSSLLSLIDRLDYFHPNRLSVLSAQTTALLLLQRKGKFSHFVSPLAPTVKISAKYSPHAVGYCWILSTCRRRIENIPSPKRSEQQPDSCETDNATLSAPFDSLHRILANILFVCVASHLNSEVGSHKSSDAHRYLSADNLS